MSSEDNPKVELWEGYEVTVNTRLMKDVDYLSDLATAQKENDVNALTMMKMALVGGENGENTQKVYDDIRQHIIEQMGYFDIDEFARITRKIDDALPKTGSRAERRSWKTTR